MSTFITRFQPPATHSVGRRLAVKDLIDMAGVPTTNGSRVIAEGATPARDDAVCLAGTRAAEAAGEVTVVGKTNMHELAFGVTGINPWFGTPVNPLDDRLVPGGSSSGSAVAVGAGEADLAFGSDTGGSIRIPAACCAVVGLKTTRGRVSLEGVLPLAPSLDTVGPMARTVAGVVAGMALLEPGFAPAAPARDEVDGGEERTQNPHGGLRVGRVRLPAEPRIDDALDAALAAAGFQVTDLQLPGWDAATAATMYILGAEAWHIHAELWRQHGDGLSPDVRARLESSSSITEAEVATAWRQAKLWVAELAEIFTRVDLLALPTLAAAPPVLADAAQLTEIRYVTPFNLAGIPALVLPVATAAGVPASLQLAGPAMSEELLVAAGAAVESAAGLMRTGG
jgi:amidase